MANISASVLSYILTTDGLVPTPYTAESLAQTLEYEPQGVYTVARTFHGDHALLLDAHLDRLEQSARLVGLPLELDRARLRAALRTLLHQAGYPDAKFRITVPHEQPDWAYLSIGPYEAVPAAVQKEGAHVITVPLVRHNPIVKTTEWMSVRRPAYESLPSGVYEGILVSGDGLLLEGMSSNFYAVIDGVLRTAAEGVLEGITRRAIFALASGVLPLNLTPVDRDDLPHAQEAMLTSSGRGVVPITIIDGQPVGNGLVGPLVSEIRRLYDAWTETHIEPI